MLAATSVQHGQGRRRAEPIGQKLQRARALPEMIVAEGGIERAAPDIVGARSNRSRVTIRSAVVRDVEGVHAGSWPAA